MKKRYVKIASAIVIVLGILSYSSVMVSLKAQEQKTTLEQTPEKNGINSRSDKPEEVIYDLEKTEEIEDEAEAAIKEVEIQEKTVALEKKKAEMKLKEAEAAKKEAESLKETAKNRREVKEATEAAAKKEKEARAAIEKVKIAENKMLAAQMKAKNIKEELLLAQQKAAYYEEKNKEKRNLLHRKLFQTGLVLLLGYSLIFLLVSIINRQVKDVKVKHVVRKNVIYLINVIILLYIFFVWIQKINSITVFLSVMGAGLALALQEVILCIAGWFLILVRSPFDVGDRVELGGVKGDVIDIRLFQTALLEIGNWVDADQSTGRIVNVPNSTVFKKENYNYNRGFEFIWNEIKILVTFESDWKRAEEIMIAHAAKEVKEVEAIVSKKIKRMTKRYMIHYEKFTPIVYVDIKDSGVLLSLRYLTDVRKRRTTQNDLCRAILKDFEQEEKVNFAYPTYRIVK